MRNTAFVFIFLCLAFGAGAGTGPAVTFKQLYDEWERLAGDSAVSDSALKEAMNDTLLSAPHPDSGRADSADTTTRKLLLLIGDSMADCLSWTLTKYCVLLGYDLKTVCFVASTTDKWDNHRFMARLVKKHKPDFVMLCLGSNEFFLHPKKIRGRAPYIKDIIDQADTVPLVWIGPPLLGETRTFDTVISDIIGPDRYFPSSGLVLDRQADNRHPSIRASWIWADTVARWIEHSSRYLLAMVPAGKPARSLYERKDYAAVAGVRIKAVNDSLAKVEADSLAKIQQAQKTAAAGKAPAKPSSPQPVKTSGGRAGSR